MTTQTGVGIDLGFQQACLAVMTDTNKTHVILGRDGQPKTPVYISYSFSSPNKFTTLVGTEATMLKGQKGIYGPKRILGRHFSDPEVQTFIGEERLTRFWQIFYGNPFYIHRPDNQILFRTLLQTGSIQYSLKNLKHMSDFAKLYYQQKMDPFVSSLKYVSEETFDEAHRNALHEAMKELCKLYPATPALLDSAQSVLTSLFDKYSLMNNRKKNSQGRIAIGIDLGTSYSCLAVITNNELEFIPDPSSAIFTPTCITIEEDDITFGHVAQKKAVVMPQSCVFDIKRMIGRHIQDPQIAQLRKFWPFRIGTSEGSVDICVQVLEKNYRPEELITLFVKHLIENAETFLNHDVVHAVVAIPAYFTPRQVYLTKEAFHDAGINVLRFLNEPTAASLAYSDVVPKGSNRTCLIFDLGGGTLDLAILEIIGSNHVKIRAVDGDPFLGGADFDNSLMKHCIEEFEKKHNIQFQDLKNYTTTLRRLKITCETAKEELSYRKQATVSLDAIYKEMDLVVRVNQSTFESLIEEQLKKCMEIVDRIVESVEISEVVLVGGSSRIPRVRTLLKEKFGGKVITSEKFAPNEAVARGATLLAARIQNNDNSLCIEELEKRILV
ncbi:unnamed protein product [Allacma fusca]|uniref:Uncharacterized protein n=1 Tax=Allacma fusca TaxID=39272 RepID=A0A8J2NQG7_9HEXA|nr:unnamed protein product [Allacma fusca]